MLKGFISNLKNKGLEVNPTLVRRMYNGLNPLIKKEASKILLPVEGEKDYLYGMDNTTGELVPFNFSRASSATQFDSNIDLKVADANVARIDYGYYNDSGENLLKDITPRGYYNYDNQFVTSGACIWVEIDTTIDKQFYVKSSISGSGTNRLCPLIFIKEDGSFETPISNKEASLFDVLIIIPEDVVKIRVSSVISDESSFMRFPWCYNYKNVHQPKILIEKSSTNLCTDSDVILEIAPLKSHTSIQDIDALGYFTKMYQFPDPIPESGTAGTKGGVYYVVYMEQDKRYSTSIFRNTSLDNPSFFNCISGDGRYKNPFQGYKDGWVRINNYYDKTATSANTYSGTYLYYNGIDHDLQSRLTGYQVEEGDAYTSFIPTLESQVTRSADLLSYELKNDCSVYLKTTKQNVVLEKSAGIWNIHEELNNEGILEIAIFEKVLTHDEKLELLKDSTNEEKLKSLFFQDILKDGGIINEDLFLSQYNKLSEKDKQSDVVILPGAYKEGVVYALNKDFSYTKLDFSRASSATLFDKNQNMQLIGLNSPRIDYANYSKDAKILIEKSSTNYAPTSEILPNTGWVITTPQTDINFFNFIKKGHLCEPLKSSGFYRNFTAVPDYENLHFSVFVEKDNDIPILFGTNGNSDATMYMSKQDYIYESFANRLYRVISTQNPNNTLTACTKYNYNNNQQIVISGAQVESSFYSSYIPTNGSQVTRSADLLSIDLDTVSTIKLKTTKQDTILNKNVGVWNIHEDLENEGIYSITINKN